MTTDPRNSYLYDAQGRLCAGNNGGVGFMWQYIYDASGTRVAKGSITVWPANCASLSDFTLTNLYLLDSAGNQVTELDSSGKWMHSNAWQGGHLTGTYDNIALHFTLSDPLGTKRVQANAQGAPEQNFFMLPWGNDFNNTFAVTSATPTGGVAAPDATEHHFTGKERDTASCNDYFGARYFNSMTGRWLSPDWSAKEEPVPYAKLDNPQSLNLYGYVFNNPLGGVDADGHGTEDPAYNQYIAHLEVVAISNGMNAGDAMQAGLALEAAQQTNAQAFDAIWNNYPSHAAYDSGTAGTSGESIQQLTGVDVVDTCALRMSYALNQSGYTISKKDGKSAMLGSDGKYYLVGQADVGKFITKHFGAPQNIGKSGVAGFDQSAQGSGFVRFSIQFTTGTATGHIALFRQGSYHEGDEEDYTNPGPGHYVVQGIQYWRMQ